jgi:hypothetical protein
MKEYDEVKQEHDVVEKELKRACVWNGMMRESGRLWQNALVKHGKESDDLCIKW